MEPLATKKLKSNGMRNPFLYPQTQRVVQSLRSRTMGCVLRGGVFCRAGVCQGDGGSKLQNPRKNLRFSFRRGELGLASDGGSDGNEDPALAALTCLIAYPGSSLRAVLASIGHAISVLLVSRNGEKKCYPVPVVNPPPFQTPLENCDVSRGVASLGCL